MSPWPGMGRLVKVGWGVFLGVTFGVEAVGAGRMEPCQDGVRMVQMSTDVC